MFLHSFLALTVLFSTQPSKEFNWRKAIDEIAPHMEGFNKPGANSETSCKRLNDLLGKLGLSPRFDAKIKKQSIGLFIAKGDSVIPIEGAADGSLVFLQRGDSGDIDPWNLGTIAIFFRERGKMHGYWLRSPTLASRLVLPKSAVFYRHKLVIDGTYGWFGNGPQEAIRSYQKVGNGWRLFAYKTAAFESWGSERLHLSPNGRQIVPVRFKSRTLPRYLGAGHVDANLSYEEEWKFVDGRPKLAWKRLRDTAYNALDRLYHAICIQDRTTIRKSSRNEAIYRKMLALHAKSQGIIGFVKYPTDVCDGDSTVLGIDTLAVMFHFERFKDRWVVAKLMPLENRKQPSNQVP